MNIEQYNQAFHEQPGHEFDNYVKVGDLVSPFTKRVLTQAEVDAFNGFTVAYNRLHKDTAKQICLESRKEYLKECFLTGADEAMLAE
ncbi:hypothetical protein [Marinicellulosiphila megalodicopiae]|uniref:hypothetical protein n=1 Tax=Marinicellulosiphila megalodicopiae TaxID=2724896 RepID=UPI003BB0CEF6